MSIKIQLIRYKDEELLYTIVFIIQPMTWTWTVARSSLPLYNIDEYIYHSGENVGK